VCLAYTKPRVQTPALERDREREREREKERSLVPMKEIRLI
jgi:hypothetical protein